jgi:hypothetical protein
MRSQPRRLGRVSTRFRCAGCGNLTRFDVIASRRTREFHHFSVGGELSVDDTELLEERIESISCRWCGATGAAIEHLEEAVIVEEGGLQAAQE